MTLANEACRLTEYKSDFILSTLAAAYAESGDFDSAVKWASKGVEVSTKKNLEEMKKELASYKRTSRGARPFPCGKIRTLRNRRPPKRVRTRRSRLSQCWPGMYSHAPP